MKKFTALLTSYRPVYLNSAQAAINFNAVYDATSDEHRKWAQATPSAYMNLNVTSEFADNFEPGKYVVTFEKVED